MILAMHLASTCFITSLSFMLNKYLHNMIYAYHHRENTITLMLLRTKCFLFAHIELIETETSLIAARAVLYDLSIKMAVSSNPRPERP